MRHVPASDVFKAVELTSKLVNLQPGETLDHEWGFIRREETVKNPADIDVPVERHPESLKSFAGIPVWVPGFRIANPSDTEAEGDWFDGIVQPLVVELYERHLARTQNQ